MVLSALSISHRVLNVNLTPIPNRHHNSRNRLNIFNLFLTHGSAADRGSLINRKEIRIFQWKSRREHTIAPFKRRLGAHQGHPLSTPIHPRFTTTSAITPSPELPTKQQFEQLLGAITSTTNTPATAAMPSARPSRMRLPYLGTPLHQSDRSRRGAVTASSGPCPCHLSAVAAASS
jgi:hypothetical protein